MLEVREQVRLSFRRMLEICMDSIAHRLMRSVVTVGIVLLAIAFLAFVMAEGHVGRTTRNVVLERTARMNAYAQFLRKASAAESEENMVAACAALRGNDADVANLRAWGHLSAAQTDAFIAQSRTAMQYLKFFDDLSIGRRALLIGDRTGLGIFDWLSQDENRRAFSERLAAMQSVRLPGDTAGFQEFHRTWPAFRRELEVVRKNHERTLHEIAAYAGAEGIGAKLKAEAASGTDREFFEKLAELGLRIDASALPDIRYGMEHHARVERAIAWLRQTPVRVGWNRQFHEKFNPREALDACARSPGRIRWIEARLREGNVAGNFDPADFLRIAREHAEWDGILNKEQRLLGRYGYDLGFSSRTLWLIFVSFLVCGVGIANAMLMSVLERFKEIATMKCLGARNGTIAFLFVTESTIIGAVGGVAGMIVGFLIAYTRLSAMYGGFVFARFPAMAIFQTMGICLGCSLFLAMVAAIYPAWVASRMAPMDAMRVD